MGAREASTDHRGTSAPFIPDNDNGTNFLTRTRLRYCGAPMMSLGDSTPSSSLPPVLPASRSLLARLSSSALRLSLHHRPHGAVKDQRGCTRARKTDGQTGRRTDTRAPTIDRSIGTNDRSIDSSRAGTNKIGRVSYHGAGRKRRSEGRGKAIAGSKHVCKTGRPDGVVRMSASRPRQDCRTSRLPPVCSAASASVFHKNIGGT